MTDMEFDKVLKFFEALANDTRLRIVGLLTGRRRNVQELSVLLGVREPTISHHLGILARLDLLDRVVEGNTHWYSLRTDHLRRLGKSIFEKSAMAKFPRADEQRWHDRIIENFVENGCLKQIPASRKKRWVILRWLAEKFDLDTRYSESALNDIIQRYHQDSATLRRELVGYKMLARQNNIYWRLPESEWRTVE